MPVVGERDVRDAHARGRRTLAIEDGAIITPKAVQASQRLGVALVPGGFARPAPLAADAGTAIRRTLYRRNPRWVPSDAPKGLRPVRLGRVGFVGAGGVGANTAHLAALSDLAEELVLVDVVPDVAASIALDLEHAAGITRAACRASGGTSLALLAGCDVVVVTAGRPRTPGMDRAALLEVNGAVVRQTAEGIANHCPDAVVIVVTNPLEEMTHEMWRASGLSAERVLGMAGTLDSSRFRGEIARMADVSPRDVHAITLGSHGAEMVPIVSTATVRGRPLRDVLTDAEIRTCVTSTLEGGAAVVRLRRTGSATLAPAHATVEVLDALRGARAGTVPVAAMLRGEYGLHEVFLGVPAVLGPKGVIEVVELPLADEERQALQQAGEAITARLAGQWPDAA